MHNNLLGLIKLPISHSLNRNRCLEGLIDADWSLVFKGNMKADGQFMKRFGPAACRFLREC